jgi:hypothetical protein
VHLCLRPGEIPAEEIEGMAADVVEIDEQRLLDRLENPERRDDGEKIEEHQDDKRPFAPVDPCRDASRWHKCFVRDAYSNALSAVRLSNAPKE